MKNPTVYMLIGLPGSGKSSYIENSKKLSELFRVSSDKFIEAFAEAEGKTYNEVFKSVVKDAARAVNRDVEYLISEGRSFVWDQTNLTEKSRKDKLRRIPDHYEKIAIMMNTPLEVCLERNAARDRSIPEAIIIDMYSKMENPSVNEGFNEIINVH